MKKQQNYVGGTLALLLLLLVVFPAVWFGLDKTNTLSAWGLVDPNNPPSE